MTAITEIELQSWDEFDELVRERRYRRWIYRGHTDSSYPLESSIFRAFRETAELTKESRGKSKVISRISHERVSLNKFMATAKQYDVSLPTDQDPLEWLAVMQHYGAPTRLLDFTFSAYVAAYFALEKGTSDCAIYCLRHEVFREYDESNFKKIDSIYRQILDKENNIIYVYEPRSTTPRLLAQQGLFLVSGSLSISHEKIIEKYNLKEKDAVKIIIKKGLRDEGIHHLRSMNILSTILFTGIEGFCKSFRHQPFFVVQSEGRIGELKKEEQPNQTKKTKPKRIKS
jgi:hypothetical protein